MPHAILKSWAFDLDYKNIIMESWVTWSV